MSYKIYLKDDIANEINNKIGSNVKEFTVTDLVITNGLIHKGSYSIPIQSILFIEEI